MNKHIQQQMIQPKLKMIMEYQKIKNQESKHFIALRVRHTDFIRRVKIVIKRGYSLYSFERIIVSLPQEPDYPKRVEGKNVSE